MKRLLALGCVLLAVACGGRQAEVPPPDPGEETPVVEEVAEQTEPTQLEEQTVTLYFPSTAGDGLVPERAVIIKTVSAEHRAKQILSELMSGPQGKRAVRVLPRGVRLRQVYVLDDGTAFADFSSDLRNDLGGGSDHELLAVYSIVNSLTMNLPEVRRVGILVSGQPIQTLTGHVDLSRPLVRNRSLIL